MELSMHIAEAIKKMREMTEISIRNLSYSTHANTVQRNFLWLHHWMPAGFVTEWTRAESVMTSVIFYHYYMGENNCLFTL